MKFLRTTCFAAALVLVSTIVHAQRNICESGYLPFKEGISLELTHYDKKGKPTAITKEKVVSVSETNGGFKATVEMENTDEKGKSQNKGSFDMTCSGNSVFMDLRSMMNPSVMAGAKDFELVISGDALELPNSMMVGLKLPDASMTMKSLMNGLTLMSIEMNVTNRKVEAGEVVTTPAGTFECVRISQETELKSFVKSKMKTVTWYAIGVGLVKTENYDKNDKLESSTVLTKFAK